mmetsp:Transcript_2167/g.3752  ORF Transcript_2167/g.3752 Transcript_2167/m.3752 type:complete len:235 (-) Transcript_2167:2722-3426(-)
MPLLRRKRRLLRSLRKLLFRLKNRKRGTTVTLVRQVKKPVRGSRRQPKLKNKLWQMRRSLISSGQRAIIRMPNQRKYARSCCPSLISPRPRRRRSLLPPQAILIQIAVRRTINRLSVPAAAKRFLATTPYRRKYLVTIRYSPRKFPATTPLCRGRFQATTPYNQKRFLVTTPRCPCSNNLGAKTRGVAVVPRPKTSVAGRAKVQPNSNPLPLLWRIRRSNQSRRTRRRRAEAQP